MLSREPQQRELSHWPGGVVAMCFLGGTADGLLGKDQMSFSCYIVTAVARTSKPDPDNLFILASLNCNKRKQRAKQGKLRLSEGWEGHAIGQVDGVLFPLPFLVGLTLPPTITAW